MAKNWILFIVLSSAVLVGWQYLERQLFPPVPKKNQIADNNKQKTKDEEKKSDLEEKNRPEEKKQKEKIVEEKKKPDEKPPAKLAEAKVFELIGEDEKPELRVWLTTRGAGVAKLVLPRFRRADYLGRPAPKEERLELIPDDPFVSSFRMYHYEDYKESQDVRPVLGLGEMIWEVHQGPKKSGEDEWSAVFRAHVPQTDVTIYKTYTLKPQDFHIGLAIKVVNEGKAKTKFRYQLTGAHGLPIEGEWYTSFFRGTAIGMVDPASKTLQREFEDSGQISHLAGGHRVPPFGYPGSNYIQYAGVVNQYFGSIIVVDQQQAPKIDAQRVLAWARPSHESLEIKGHLASIDLGEEDDGQSGKRTPTLEFTEPGQPRREYKLLPGLVAHLKELKIKKGDPAVLSYYALPDEPRVRVATWIRRGQTPRPVMEDVTVRVHSEVLELEPARPIEHRFLLYHGPVKTMLLGQLGGIDDALVDRYTHDYHLKTLTDYPSNNAVSRFFYSIGWTKLLIFFTGIMHHLLYWLHFLCFGNYGPAILLLTIVVRGLMFPISRKQAMLSIKMQELTPELKKIRERYKDDPLTAQRESMALMRKHNAHPMAGCLPVLMQMPIFLGLYYALQESIHFRLAPFAWSRNLAAPDMLLWWGEAIPWLTDPDNQGGMLYLGPYLNLLPFFAVALMVVQQKYLAPPPTSEEQEMQQKTMQWMMMFMGVLFYKVAAGLCIYFIVSSGWGLLERKFLPKKKAQTVAAPAKSESTAIQSKTRGKGKPSPTPEEPLSWWGRMKKRWEDILEQAQKK